MLAVTMITPPILKKLGSREAVATFPILKKLGGREAAAVALTAAGMPTTKDQVRMWETRKRIPGDAYLALMRLAEDTGLFVSSVDFEAVDKPERVAT